MVRRNWHTTEVIWSEALKRTIEPSPGKPWGIFAVRMKVYFQFTR
jgi:hypothetical protein